MKLYLGRERQAKWGSGYLVPNKPAPKQVAVNTESQRVPLSCRGPAGFLSCQQATDDMGMSPSPSPEQNSEEMNNSRYYDF